MNFHFNVRICLLFAIFPNVSDGVHTPDEHLWSLYNCKVSHELTEKKKVVHLLLQIDSDLTSSQASSRGSSPFLPPAMPLLQVNVPVLESYNEAAIDVPPELLSASGLNNSSRSSPSKSVVALVIYRLNRLCVLFVFNSGQKSRYSVGCCPTVIAAANGQIGRNYAITTRYQIDP